MAKGANQKLKLLYLAKIFYEQTDEEHGLTMSQIIQALEACGVSAERKTLYLDFEQLRLFGLEIESDKIGKNTLYRLVSREFELPELKLLVDCVQSSKFITQKKSQALIHKLETLVSRHEARQLQRQVLIAGRVKTMNESIYYNVDDLNNAINQNRQIRFHYFQWNVDKKEEFRHGGAWYHVSPWHLRWDDENYYLIGYDSASREVRHYRVDKMKDICVLDAPREGQDLIADFDAAAYTKRLFGMYGGEAIHVALEAENRLIGILIDRFGKDIPVVKKDAEHFLCYVDVAVSPQFYGWVASIGGGIRITAPQNVVDEMRDFAQELCRQYA